MLVLVRVIPPVEYGRAASVVAFLKVLNSASCARFMSQGLQVPGEEEPDWTAHWQVGLVLQLVLGLVCLLAAAGAWSLPEYRALSPLLALGAVGLCIDAPAQLNLVMLQRDLNFARLRLLAACATLLATGTTLGLAFLGLGAFALVLGGNVLLSIPFGIDLLVVRRWRPKSGWFRKPNWRAYRPALAFGGQQVLSGFLQAGQAAVTAGVLPSALGFYAIGLINRADGLFSSTALRISGLISETVYPALPKLLDDEERFRRAAGLFVKLLLLVLFPGAAFLVVAGSDLSRVLYGARWIAADPLLGPAALAGLALGLTAAGYRVLLARSHLRACLGLDFLKALCLLPALCGVLWWREAEPYLWLLALGGLPPAWAALRMASPSLAPGWLQGTLVPTLLPAATAAAVLAVVVDDLGHDPFLRLGGAVCIYCAVWLIVLRTLFASTLRELCSRAPGGSLVQRALFLRGSGEADAH